MKKRALLLIITVLCMLRLPALAQSASATIQLADNMTATQNVHLGLPEGMEYHSLSWSGEILNIVIDTHATDWDRVATAARKSGSLVIHPGIEKPDNAKGCVMSSDYYRGEDDASSEDSEARILLGFNKEITEKLNRGEKITADEYGYACSYQGWSIGRYDEGTGLFIPEAIPAQNGAGFAAYWEMNDGTYNAERVRFTVSYTEYEPVYVRRQNVAADDITMNVNNNSAVITNEKEDGRIVYTMNYDGTSKEVHTAIAVPEQFENKNDLQAYLLSNGKEERQNISDGRVVLYYKIAAENMLYKKDWAIRWAWKNADEEMETEVFYLEAEFHVGEPKFTASYMDFDEENQSQEPGQTVEEVLPKPLPAENLVWTTANPLDGLKASYDAPTGDFHMNIDKSKLPPNRKTDLSQTTVDAKVIVPDDAVKCNVYMFRGDVIYGDSGEKAWPIHKDLSVVPGQELAVPELAGRIFFREIPVTLHNGKHMSYYVAPMPVGQHGGETLVFEWVAQDGGKTRHYVALTSDAYKINVRRNPSETKNPNKAVSIPTMQSDAEFYLETAVLPQKGDNVIRYEITLTDGYGSKVQPDASMLLYIPYPDGQTMEECAGYTFVVYHQLTDGSYEEYSTQNGKLMLTPYGLCMEVNSFSPYFLNWEEAPDVSALPETGDHSYLAAYLMLLILCGAAAGTMRKMMRVTRG